MHRQLPAYMSLLQRGPIAMIISRMADGLILEANEPFLSLSGYSRAETMGRNVADLQLWHDPAARVHMVEEIRQHGYLNNLAMDMRRKGGDVIRLLCSAHVIGPPDDAHLFTIIVDLRQVDGSLAFFAQDSASLEFAEAAGKIGFWDLDSASGRVHWSYGSELMYGLPKGGFGGSVQEAINRIHPDDVARTVQESQAALDLRQRFDITYRIIRTDGVVRWVTSRGCGRWDDQGALLGASGIKLDITEQIARDQSLRLQAQVITTMAEGVILIHAETGRIVEANPRFEQMLGYASGGLLGLHIAAINASSDQDPQAVVRHIMDELNQHGHWRGEVKNRCANGREIWTTSTVSEFVHEELGRVWVSVHTDINDQHLAQQARDQALAELRRLSLNIQDSVEAERLALSREVHDQLGAALTGMRMQLEALARQLPAQSAGLSQALLDVAQTARNTQLVAREICTRLRPQVLDDGGLVEACRWYARDWSARVGIAVQGRFAKLPSEPDGRVATDLFRVLQELLTNVARHAGATRVQISLSGSAAGLYLRVQDDGHGFAPDHTTLGFGLLGVRERVRHHAGEFTLDSSASGTRVRVRMQHLTTH
jgi:PAS domain S-box-containing protein